MNEEPQHDPKVTRLSTAVLVHARTSAGLVLEDAASLSWISVERLRVIELHGHVPDYGPLFGHPSRLEQVLPGYEPFCLSELRRLAEVYKRPLAYFFLPYVPPGEFNCPAYIEFSDLGEGMEFWCKKDPGHEEAHNAAGETNGLKYLIQWYGDAAEEKLAKIMEAESDG